MQDIFVVITYLVCGCIVLEVISRAHQACRRRREMTIFLDAWGVMLNLSRNRDSNTRYRRRLEMHIAHHNDRVQEEGNKWARKNLESPDTK
jgi:hypothetical protein